MKNNNFYYNVLMALLLFAFLVLFYLFFVKDIIEKNENKVEYAELTEPVEDIKKDPEMIFYQVYGEIISKNENSIVLKVELENGTKDIKIKIDDTDKNNVVTYQKNKKLIFDYNEIGDNYFANIKLKEGIDIDSFDQEEGVYIEEAIIYKEPVSE